MYLNHLSLSINHLALWRMMICFAFTSIAKFDSAVWLFWHGCGIDCHKPVVWASSHLSGSLWLAIEFYSVCLCQEHQLVLWNKHYIKVYCCLLIPDPCPHRWWSIEYTGCNWFGEEKFLQHKVWWAHPGLMYLHLIFIYYLCLGSSFRYLHLVYSVSKIEIQCAVKAQ